MLRHIRPVKGIFYRYTYMMQLLHWSIAFGIIGMILFGFYMHDLPLSIEKARMYGLHKATGATLLALIILRIIVKFLSYHPPLPLAGAHARYVHAASQAGHVALYFFLLYMPISGWLMSSAAGMPVSVFGYVTLPNLIDPDPIWKNRLSLAHTIGVWGFITVITVHILAVVFHMLVIKDRLLFRMLPFRNNP